jgi:histidinol phosphatase-like PHP family hydrolase
LARPGKPIKSTNNTQSRQWRRIDLHLHTPGSSDYQQPSITYLDILRQADVRGLEIIAFTDHNTIAGYAAMQEEIKQLELLEKLNRLEFNERHRLAEYRRLLDKILVLPGF